MMYRILLGGLVLMLLGNCYATGKVYVPGQPALDPGEKPIVFSADDPQFETGEPYLILDAIGHYFFSLLAKLLLWNWSYGNHDIGPATQAELKTYMARNKLTGVKVRFNQYAPLDELARMYHNERVHWALKWSLGLFSWLTYTLFPERLFAGLIGGDHYNPYSNTINLYSGSIPIALHEGGHAKDYEMRVNRTGYVAFRMIPIAGPLYQEAIASDDAVVYLRSRCEKNKELAAYSELSPAYATYLFGSLLPGPASLLAAIPGHAYGFYKRKKEEDRPITNCSRTPH